MAILALCGALSSSSCAREPARSPVRARHAPLSARPAVSGRPPRVLPAPSAGPPPVSAPRSADESSSGPALARRFNGAAALRTQAGLASYYADSLAGRSTASGAPYQPSAFSAAHRSLPFGTVLRVTRIEGGEVVYVRVNDRGPFGGHGRILDLSRAAASALGITRVGVARVRTEVVEYGAPAPRRRR